MINLFLQDANSILGSEIIDDANLMESIVVDSFSELSSMEFQNWEDEWRNSTEETAISSESGNNSTSSTTEATPIMKTDEVAEKVSTKGRIQSTFDKVYNYFF